MSATSRGWARAISAIWKKAEAVSTIASIFVRPTGMPRSDEAKLFRFTLKHSVLLASVIGIIVTLYAYVLKAWSV